MPIFYAPQEGDTCQIEYEFKDDGSKVSFSVDMQNDRWGIAWYHHTDFGVGYKLLPEFPQESTHAMGLLHFDEYGRPMSGDISLIAKRIRFGLETGNWEGIE